MVYADVTQHSEAEFSDFLDMNQSKCILHILLGNDLIEVCNRLFAKQGLNAKITEGYVRECFKQMDQVLPILLL